METLVAAPPPKRAAWLVIPCYNDSARLGRVLPELCQSVRRVPMQVSLQVVDDGSTLANRTALGDLICEMQVEFPFLLPPIYQQPNQGKGAAILRGWEVAVDPDWLGFLDADGAVPSYEVCRILSTLGHQPDDDAVCYFASRVKMRGKKMNRSFLRHLTGRIFATLVGAMIDPEVYDSQCGFKLIPVAAYRLVKPLLREKRFAFDVELLAALNHFGCPVEEVPVDWSDIPGSKVSLVRDSIRMFGALRAIRSRMRAIEASEQE